MKSVLRSSVAIISSCNERILISRDVGFMMQLNTMDSLVTPFHAHHTNQQSISDRDIFQFQAIDATDRIKKNTANSQVELISFKFSHLQTFFLLFASHFKVSSLHRKKTYIEFINANVLLNWILFAEKMRTIHFVKEFIYSWVYCSIVLCKHAFDDPSLKMFSHSNMIGNNCIHRWHSMRIYMYTT